MKNFPVEWPVKILQEEAKESLIMSDIRCALDSGSVWKLLVTAMLRGRGIM